LRQLLTIFSFFTSLCLFAQEDTLRRQSVSEVHVKITVIKPLVEEFVLDRAQLELLNVTDAGEAISKLPGTNVKNYGSLGGLKTVSVRGLNPQDNSVLVDGFEQYNSQSGLYNLGRIEADNIESIRPVYDLTEFFLIPVGAQLKGTSVILSTQENTFSDETRIRANVKYGSFDQVSSSLLAKGKVGKLYASTFLKYRQANGNYPFSLTYDGIDTTYRRDNNFYSDLYAGGTLGFRSKKSMVRLIYRYKMIDQELPGAVILYNSTADEQMKTDDHGVFVDGQRLIGTKGQFRLYASLNSNRLNYQDPNYLNSSGGIDATYANNSANGGGVFYYRLLPSLRISGGSELRYSSLDANQYFANNVQRMHSQSVIGLGLFHNKKVHLNGQLGYQFVSEFQDTIQLLEDAFTPEVALIVDDLFKLKRSKTSFYYKTSFRMPSFNERYYGGIGNVDLLPERTYQFGLRYMLIKEYDLSSVAVSSGLYYNNIQDKILALPTQNLFIWSMQNVGRVEVYGSDIGIRYSRPLLLGPSIWKLTLAANYTYNRSLDISNSDSPTYKDQIAYTPVHVGNIDVNLNSKKLRLGISSFFTGMRYVLNENIPQNEEEMFWTLDAVASRRIELKDSKHKFDMQLNVKNLLNRQYAYVRGYVMPGINFLITIRYAFN
jgi:vitamin B12 transporter